MSMPIWPEGVPDVPLVDSWSCDDPWLDQLATDMDGGNKRARMIPGDITTHQYSIMMTPAQFDTFNTWARVTLRKGTLRFTGRYWNGKQMVSGATMQLAMKPKSGTQQTKVIVQMATWVYNNG